MGVINGLSEDGLGSDEEKRNPKSIEGKKGKRKRGEALRVIKRAKINGSKCFILVSMYFGGKYRCIIAKFGAIEKLLAIC